MNYEYECQKCGHVFERNLPIDKRDQPLKEPCPNCGERGMVVRNVTKLAITSGGVKSLQQRAGDGFNDLLKKIKKDAGQTSTIQTK